jgi:hypothetical protein
MEFAWDADAGRGETEVFVPWSVFPTGSAIEIEPSGVSCRRDEARQLLILSATADGPARVTLTAP